MRELSHLTLLLLLIANYCYSQSGWFWQNPLPTNSNLNDVCFINSNTAYAVGWHGVIIKTTDGGASWTQLRINSDLKLYSIQFINANTGFIVSGDEDEHTTNNVVLKTTNSGENWYVIYNFPNSHLNNIFMIDGNTGFIAGRYYPSVPWNARIYKTTNGGNNWTEYLFENTNTLNSIFFVNNQSGYTVGDNGMIFKTTNQGINWNSLSVISFGDLKSVFFINDTTGYIAGWGGKLYKTENGGINWTLLSLNTTSNLWDIKFFNPNTMFVIGGGPLYYQPGRIFKSSNIGNSWDSTTHASGLRRIAFANNFITVGNNGSLLVSFDAGLSWMNKKNSVTNVDLFKTYFVSSETGYCIGDSGKVFRTSNGGSNWSSCIVPTNKLLSSCYFFNAQTGIVVGRLGTSLKTTNNGVNWIVLNMNTSYNLTSLTFVNGNIGYCTGGEGVFKSSDQGNSWQTVLDSNFNLSECYFLNENTGYVCGGDGPHPDKIFKTSNGGTTWSSIPTHYNTIHKHITFLNENTGFTGGVENAPSVTPFFKTTNAGLNWSPISLPLPVPADYSVKSINFVNNSTIIILIGRYYSGGGSDLFVTKNSGMNWEHYSDRFDYATVYSVLLNNLFTVNNSLSYGVGDDGSILKFDKDINIIRINNISQTIPNNFSLSQNYPNPFNPQTKIKFDIPVNVKGQTQNVKLVIYDLLGREVTTLVNEQLKPGSYEIDWDGSNFSSSVYFYKIISGDFVETKKMVLMK